MHTTIKDQISAVLKKYKVNNGKVADEIAETLLASFEFKSKEKWPRLSEQISTPRHLPSEAKLVLECFKQLSGIPAFEYEPTRIRKTDQACMGALERIIQFDRAFEDLSSPEVGWYMTMVGKYNHWRHRLS